MWSRRRPDLKSKKWRVSLGSFFDVGHVYGDRVRAPDTFLDKMYRLVRIEAADDVARDETGVWVFVFGDTDQVWDTWVGTNHR